MTQSITKICRQCGELKSINEFRRYYTGRKGTYKMCKACERINYRVKYLTGLSNMPPALEEELEKIYKLWDMQRAMGLEPPDWNLSNKETSTDPLTQLELMTNKVASIPLQVVEAISITSPYVTAPRARLYHWLTCKLDENTSPEYYLEDIYNTLKDQFRPKIGIDTATHLPVYDETYMPALTYILDRFYRFEDTYESRQKQ